MALTTVLPPKRLVTPVTSMAKSDELIRDYLTKVTSTGWPGWRSRAAAGSKTASTMKTSLLRFSRL